MAAINLMRVQGQAILSAVALGVAMPSALSAQSAACTQSVTTSRIALQAAAAAVVTGVEYGDMTRQGSWHMAQESNRAAVLADPSSHLHGLGSYRMARNLTANRCESVAALRRNALRGAAISLSLGAAKEVADGWYNGFSTTDLAVDAMGAGYAVAQAYVPMLRHVTPTLSIAPQAFLSKNGPTAALTDYAHQTLWLSANVHDMLPESAAKVWPAAVRLSAGRRAYGGNTPSDFVVGLDIDAERLPGSHPAWKRVKSALHNVRLPGPALVMSANGTRSVGLYW